MTAYACARCGKRERYADTYLCFDCLASKGREKDQTIAEATFPGDHRQQRLLLTQSYKWAGWNRRIGGSK